jgi:hypothetical protein
MNIIKNGLIILLSLMVANLICFNDAYAAASDTKDKVTKTAPSGISSSETPLPSEQSSEQQSWFSKYKWWLLGGVAIAAAGAAAAGGGGGGGGGGSDAPSGDDTGNVTVTWSD